MAQSFSGTGDDVLSLNPFDIPKILTAKNSGDSIFQIKLYDSEGEVDTPVIHAGKFSGTLIINQSSNSKIETIQILSNGNWDIEIDDLENVPIWMNKEIEGKSPQVLQLPETIKPNNIFTLKSVGNELTLVTTHDESGFQIDLKVSAIDYMGKQLIGSDVKFIQINSHNKWIFNILI